MLAGSRPLAFAHSVSHQSTFGWQRQSVSSPVGRPPQPRIQTVAILRTRLADSVPSSSLVGRGAATWLGRRNASRERVGDSLASFWEGRPSSREEAR